VKDDCKTQTLTYMSHTAGRNFSVNSDPSVLGTEEENIHSWSFKSPSATQHVVLISKKFLEDRTGASLGEVG